MAMGPSVVVAKRGEYGAALFDSHGFFALPGMPLEVVKDPTGAGDSFAGGFLGYLDGIGGDATPWISERRWPTGPFWRRSTSRSSERSGFPGSNATRSKPDSASCDR